MITANTIQDELRSLNSELPLHNAPVFTVPEGYFEQLSSTILAKVKQEVTVAGELNELSPLLAGISKEMPYSVPFSFFENMPLRSQALVEDQDSLILASIGKKLPYTVPQDYFDHLPVELLAKASKPTAKVVPLFARTWMRVAAAAVIGVALFLTGIRYLNNEVGDEVAVNPADSTKTLVAKVEPAVEQEMKKVSTEELEEFIENVQVTPVSKSSAAAGQDEVKALLKDVSDKEMESFLSALPTQDEEVLLTD